jgi:hypothetical protein
MSLMLQDDLWLLQTNHLPVIENVEFKEKNGLKTADF